MRKKQTVELVPSARRLIRSLRDVGYDYVHAVADIVDNSIEAKASRVNINMEFDGNDSWVRIADNGKGMSGTMITEAMRFGTERDYDPDELGSFGLGLKTASLSQCCKLSVASRTNPSFRRIEVRQWDLEYVDATNRWEVINVPPEERPDILVKPLSDTVGTVVIWESLDRVLGYKIPWGERAKASFLRLAEDLDLHLGMVFHRFLSGEARRRKKLAITLNGTKIDPWDPYARDEKATIKLPERQFEVNGDNGPGLVSYAPYILPSKERFSSLRAFDRYAGPSKWNFQQGFYVYRADRMIQSGGWCHMRTSDEHTKLARVALDFWPDLDSAFDLNVTKARVNLPADLRAQLKPHVEELARRARKAYTPATNRSATVPSSVLAGVHDSTGSQGGYNPYKEDLGLSGEQNSSGGSATSTSSQTSGEHIGRALENAAEKANELLALNRIKEVLKSDSPQAAKEIGW